MQPCAGMSKRTSYGKNYYPDVRFVRTSARVRVYPTDGFLPSADALVHPQVRVDPCPCGLGTDALTRPCRCVVSARTQVPVGTGRRRPVSARTRMDTRRMDSGLRRCGFRGAD
jgi:hypothetical protein